MKVIACVFVLLAATCCLGGCMGPVALSNALPDYDETINQLEGKALLLNIARSRNNMPPHFTDTTSVVATFNFQADATLTGDLSSNVDASMAVGATAAENPTIELTPLRGDKFATQLLTPLTDDQFRLLATETLPLDLLIRLMAKAFHYQDDSGRIISTVRNDPAYPQEYKSFRRIAMHIAALDATAELFARRVSFVEVDEVVLQHAPTAGEVLAARQNGFQYASVGGDRYTLSQQVIGNTVVTNFDTSILSDSQRAAINNQISLTPSNMVDIEIRPGYPGGDFPLQGAIQLRSINEILDFIARGIADQPEYAVAPDPRTETILKQVPGGGIAKLNPATVLTIDESADAPAGDVLHVRYQHTYYSVQQQLWDLLAFKSLYLLMQMSGQTSTERAFPITISK